MAARPWLAWYDPGVPAGIVVPDSTLPDLLATAAREYPAAPAILFYGRVIDYAIFDRLATRFAVALRNAGVAPGERVALVLPNIPQAPVAYYGALRAGAIVVLTNPIFEAGGLVRQLTDAGATTLVALSMFHPLVMAVRERASVHRVIYTNLKEFLPPGQRRLFTLLRQEREGHRVPTDEARRALWMAHMLTDTAAAPLPSCDPDEPAAILYTGGTTGEAKGVVHTHRSLVANALQVAAWLPAARRGAERVVCVLPFSHAYGMTACMNFSVAIAAAMILLPTFETAHVLHAIRRERATIFPGVPPMYAAIAEMNNARRYGLSSLRACISGAAPLPIEVQEGFERVTRARLVEGYGLTEAGPVTHANPLGSAHERHATIGIPLPSTDAKIVDATTGADLPPGRIGELLVRGPQVMQGYWNRPDDTADAFTPDGWLRTGDMARMDADGFFQIIERKKDVIIAGPYNIYPRDIEEVLYQHPKVLEAAVAGIPRPEGRPDLRAFVVLRKGEHATADEIIGFLRERLSAHKVPHIVEFRDALPRSFIGKVLRRALIDDDRQKNA
ncbi:MAG: long-chain fatty acid--CoA ligase [Roseiflexus sp.]|nr:long-chain fatty acid--CoA ligase [Roseiflexus sp.]